MLTDYNALIATHCTNSMLDYLAVGFVCFLIGYGLRWVTHER